ncbi:HD domain-containing protein [Burkholderia cenocepacia]|uniref:HD domain-containing protein n=1 Tax=Burkholderia cenocepacia TaxID=95486 RepID=UPI002B2481F1|nr:HD domain-containing protein [Burkholderia cenocepacia]MEB2545960.1 HD domain-containing protein [Burkholderia cenocepacia]
MNNKMIKDPIHGAIEFEGDAELILKSILSDPYFQRLRRVKQLGFSDFVFPSASHSRFAHSLGVYAVAKRMLKVVEPEAQGGRWSIKGKACLAAALLHDIGHGMFSHAFENAISLYVERNQSARSDSLAEACNHESISLRIIRDSSITRILEKMGDGEFPEMVARMIAKEDETCVYTSLVSSQLDADRLDYAKRDSYFAGVSSGGIDLDWLVRNLQAKEGPNGRFLYVNSKRRFQKGPVGLLTFAVSC